jgi:hypothetical protein
MTVKMVASTPGWSVSGVKRSTSETKAECGPVAIAEDR